MACFLRPNGEDSLVYDTKRGCKGSSLKLVLDYFCGESPELLSTLSESSLAFDVVAVPHETIEEGTASSSFFSGTTTAGYESKLV